MKPTSLETSPLAIASLAFSCLGAITMGILTIPGIICGVLAKRQIQRGEYTGRPLAQAGIIVGTAVLLLYLAVPLILISFIAAPAAAPLAASGYEKLEILTRENLGAVIGLTGVFIALVVLPFVFTRTARLREKHALRKVIAMNRTRG